MIEGVGVVRAEVDGGASWVACEHPERPPGPGMSYHLGFLRAGEDRRPCRGCVLAMAAAEINGHRVHPGVARLVLAKP